jgi:protein-S-isoprenylcysteine O-methyltransferase Ste14
MYLGMDLILIGVALLLGTVSCLVPVVAFAYTMNRVFVPVEEQMLAETFGEEWEKYRARVRRWILV